VQIAVDARPLAHPHSGIGRYTRELLARLIDLTPHHFHLYSDVPVQFHGTPGRVTIRSARVGVPKLGSLFAQLVFPRWCREDGIQLFWSPRHHLPPVHDIPSVVTIHDVVWRRLPGSMAPFGRTAESLLMPRAIGRATRIIAVSSATANDIEVYWPQAGAKTSVVHEAPFVVPGSDERRRDHILFVGTFEPRKNLPRMLEGYRDLLGRLPSAPRLVIAGRPGWKTNVDQIVSKLGIAGRVRVLAPADDRELSQLYSHARFLILPSLYEGFGLPIVEAMAHGKGVITSNISSMPEVAGDAAILVDPYSVEAITDAMQRLCENDGLLDELERRALARVACYSWMKGAEQTARIFAEAANGGPFV
jgi:glycosyltransferase involved in cell wall biosynthesis